MKVKVARFYHFEGDTPTKAICDIIVDDMLAIKGFRLVNGKTGLFVAYPREVGKNGQWYNTVFALTPKAANLISETVLETYRATI